MEKESGGGGKRRMRKEEEEEEEVTIYSVGYSVWNSFIHSP